MQRRVRRSSADNHHLATAARWCAAFARRPALVGALILIVLLAALGLTSLPSSSQTVATVTSAPASALAVSASAAQLGDSSTAPLSQRVPSTGPEAQPRLRSFVLSLSQCLTTLSTQSQWTLILRAGIGPKHPFSRRAIARIFHVSARREVGIERAALRKLQAAARSASCGKPPVLIHVPTQDRLAVTDGALAHPPQSAAATAGSGHPTVSPALVSAIRHQKARLSFTLTAGTAGAGLRTVTVAAPEGMAFSPPTRDLSAPIVVVKSGGRRLKLTATIRHGTLTIRLNTPAQILHVTIARSVITLTGGLARRAGGRQISALTTHVVTS